MRGDFIIKWMQFFFFRLLLPPLIFQLDKKKEEMSQFVDKKNMRQRRPFVSQTGFYLFQRYGENLYLEL